MSRYQLLVAHSDTEELEDEDSLELVEPLVLKKALAPMLPQELSLRLSD